MIRQIGMGLAFTVLMFGLEYFLMAQQITGAMIPIWASGFLVPAVLAYWKRRKTLGTTLLIGSLPVGYFALVVWYMGLLIDVG